MRHLRFLVRLGGVGAKKTLMVADVGADGMGAEQAGASRLVEVYLRSASAGFRLA